MRKIFLLLVCVSLLTSCSTLVSSLIEDDLQYIWDNTSNSKPVSHVSEKQRKKEMDRLQKEGKCTVCRGMGRSIDGKYVCSACNGTGKAVNQEEKQ